MNMNSDTKSFSTREWLFLVALLLMVEYWVFSASHAVSGEQALVNYISFASSIASILLAVTAIIYSFIQADGQQKSAGLLSFQVGEISKVSSELGTSKDELETQLAKLSAVASKIDELQELVGGKFTTMEGSLADIQQQVARSAKPESPTSPSQPSESTKTTLARSLLERTTWDADLFTYVLYNLAQYGSQEKNSIELISTHFAKPLAGLIASDSYGEYLTVGFQILSSLRAVGLAEVSLDDPVVLSEDLKNYVIARGPALEKITHDKLARGLPLIAATFPHRVK